MIGTLGKKTDVDITEIVTDSKTSIKPVSIINAEDTQKDYQELKIIETKRTNYYSRVPRCWHGWINNSKLHHRAITYASNSMPHHS